MERSNIFLLFIMAYSTSRHICQWLTVKAPIPLWFIAIMYWDKAAPSRPSCCCCCWYAAAAAAAWWKDSASEEVEEEEDSKWGGGGGRKGPCCWKRLSLLISREAEASGKGGTLDEGPGLLATPAADATVKERNTCHYKHWQQSWLAAFCYCTYTIMDIAVGLN